MHGLHAGDERESEGELTMQANLSRLVDEAIALEIRMKEDKKKLDAIKATLTAAASENMDNKNLKYMQIYGSTGRFNVTYKEKFEIDDFDRLVTILGEIAKSKISRKEEVKYDTESRFKQALIALFKNEYSNEITIDEVLRGLGLDDKTAKTVKKKLKGDYIKDRKVLESVGVSGDLEEELDAIRLYKNYELVERFFGQLTEEQREQIRRAVFVEESISVGLEHFQEGIEEDESNEYAAS
ncbi:ABC transporter permease [Paenibacillus naphthalenovorans]|uniref:ABC transporter permease n=1 Tax=Paenibacillus naphthalenovorans TaxID=162209 RepID=UPI003D2A6B01